MLTRGGALTGTIRLAKAQALHIPGNRDAECGTGGEEVCFVVFCGRCSLSTGENEREDG